MSSYDLSADLHNPQQNVVTKCCVVVSDGFQMNQKYLNFKFSFLPITLFLREFIIVLTVITTNRKLFRVFQNHLTQAASHAWGSNLRAFVISQDTGVQNILKEGSTLYEEVNPSSFIWQDDSPLSLLSVIISLYCWKCQHRVKNLDHTVSGQLPQRNGERCRGISSAVGATTQFLPFLGAAFKYLPSQRLSLAEGWPPRQATKHACNLRP